MRVFFVKVIRPGRLINVDTTPISTRLYTGVSAMLTVYSRAGNSKHQNKPATSVVATDCSLMVIQLGNIIRTKSVGRTLFEESTYIPLLQYI